MPKLIFIALLAVITFVPAVGNANTKGDQMNDSQWFQMPDEKVETRWYTFENQQGEKGQGGKTRFTRKGSP